MKTIFYKKLLLVAFLSASGLTFAQKGGLKGTLKEGTNALEFVDITLKKASDSTKTIGYAMSDHEGRFSFDAMPIGSYQLLFKLIGYKTVSKKVLLQDADGLVDLGDIQLETDSKILKAVEIRGTKKAIQKTQEGFVYNATTNITQTGGTATDLLKNIPTISVDADGAITLRGKTPLILINGKNSTITNIDQIAASSIESIEVITNPGAKYDANAESGILNIKLKKNNLSGTNGAVVLGTGAGAQGRVNSSILLNHKKGKWNFGLGYDNRFAGRTKKIDAFRTNYFIDDAHLLTQHRDDKRLEQLQNLKLNIDFSPNDKNNLSFEAIGNLEGQDNNETLYSLQQTNVNAFYSNNKRHSMEYERSKVAEFALNYEHKYADERKSLSASITSSFNRDRENTDIDTYNYDENSALLGNVFWQRTHNYENENITNAKIDYAFPMGSKSKIETGYKGTFRFFNSDFQSADNINDVYVVNSASSNIFNFKEQINAAYALFQSSIGTKEAPKWNYNAGLRVESVNNDGKTVTQNTDFNNHYIKFFPSAALQYVMGASQTLKLAYSKRINRPELDQLNPFMDITDALNPHSGNPYLKPEIVSILELGYSKDWKKYSFSANSFYRNATNSIKQYSELQSDGSVLLSPKNFGNTITYGLESIINIKPIRFYEANISVTAFEQDINGSNVAEDVVNKAFNWNGKIINTILPWKGGKIQVIGSYNSKLLTPQGYRIAVYSTDLGYQQKLGSSNGRIGLVVTDLCNTLKSGYANQTPTFSNQRTSKADTRSIMLTFAYTFKTTFKEELLENQFTPEY